MDKLPNSALLHLGRIGQFDYSFINDTMLHETRNDPQKMRIYEVGTKALQIGFNYILVRGEDEKGPGGLFGPVDEMFLGVDQKRIPLTGTWKYYVHYRKSRGINYSDINTGGELAARFVAYNSGSLPQEGLESGKLPTGDEVLQINLGVVKNQMKFDQTEIVVPVGRTVEIRFHNTDFLQHNLLIIAPGSLNRVGEEADSPDCRWTGKAVHPGGYRRTFCFRST